MYCECIYAATLVVLPRWNGWQACIAINVDHVGSMETIRDDNHASASMLYVCEVYFLISCYASYKLLYRVMQLEPDCTTQMITSQDVWRKKSQFTQRPRKCMITGIALIFHNLGF